MGVTAPPVAAMIRSMIERDGTCPVQMREIVACVVSVRLANSACVCPVLSRCFAKVAMKCYIHAMDSQCNRKYPPRDIDRAVKLFTLPLCLVLRCESES